jgi:2-amino-4-hydroxy-6-hydroxymethyldihydropteridine diphosphokinase
VSARETFLSLGSNLGDRQAHLDKALAALEANAIPILARSSLYETEPRDVPNQPWFLNMVVHCETRLFPLQFLSTLQRIEHELGRSRTGVVRRGPRVIDIDVLLFGNAVMQSPRLTIPHPRMLERRFVLEPLLEIAPDLRHPETKEPLSGFLATTAGQRLKKIGSVEN